MGVLLPWALLRLISYVAGSVLTSVPGVVDAAVLIE